MPGNDPPPDRVMIGSVDGSPVECRFVSKVSVTLIAGTSEDYRAELEEVLDGELDVEVSVSVAT